MGMAAFIELLQGSTAYCHISLSPASIPGIEK